MKNNILDKCIDNFNNAQNNIYSKVYHNKIRNMTRFTYPETIKARDILIERKILTTNKEVVKKVDIYKKKLIVKTNDNKKKLKKYLCDIVINVSGPLNVVNIKNEIPIINHLKSKGAKISAGGFLVGSNFNIKGVKNIYTSGILATNFNPDRKTIFNAILKNSKVVGKKVARILTQL